MSAFGASCTAITGPLAQAATTLTTASTSSWTPITKFSTHRLLTRSDAAGRDAWGAADRV